MPIRLREPPANAYQLVAQALSDVSGVPGNTGDRLNQVRDPSRINAALPHTVYSLGSIEIARGENIDRAARLVAWRFLVQDGSRTIGAIEFSCDIRGQNLRFASFDTGPFAEETRLAVQRAEGMTAIQRTNYEPCLLRASGVYLVALWLKSLEGGEDIVVPLNPGGPNRPPATIGGALPQSSRDLLGELRGPADVALGFDSRPTS